MATLNIPDFHDSATASAAEASLRAAKEQIDDAWIRWGICQLASLLAAHPAVDAIRLDGDGRFHGTRDSAPTCFEAGLIRKEDPSRIWTDDDVQQSRIKKSPRPHWSMDQLMDLDEVEAQLESWAGDYRFEPLVLAIHAEMKNQAVWMHGQLSAAGLCSAIGRPDLQAAFEKAELSGAAAPGAPGKPTPRV